jgi:hypothetical protein
MATRRVLLLLALMVAGAAVGAAATPAGAATTWLCRPGFELARDPCVGDLTATTVAADGSTTVRPAHSDPAAPIDCFYVYPTVSPARGANAPLAVTPEMRGIAGLQAKPFSQACRVFSPVYRQMTFQGWARAVTDRSVFDKAYRDVRAAWRDYLLSENGGHGVVLIGHSQGAAILRRLIRQEIDPRPQVRSLLVSGLLVGGNVRVRRGSDVGGDFQNIRLCGRPDQVGCIVAYSSYDAPPPSTASFPRADDQISRTIRAPGAAGLQVACTNPAALVGGEAPLRTLQIGSSTPWVEYPGLYTAQCRTEGAFTWLSVSVSPADPRAPARFRVLWDIDGLHWFDVNIAMDDLVDLVRSQSTAWLAGARP